jgi:cation diffusion facilitator CzcD-associated flavoprotein CzcO
MAIDIDTNGAANGSVNAQPNASIIGDFPQCTPNKIKIIHVGCGASGILFTHKIRKWLDNYDLKIYEKNPIAGGTWYENRYPGCACDVPAHTYTFPFEANPEWSSFYSSAGEIQEYMLKLAKKWNVDEFTQYNTEILSATWDEAEGIWKVRIKAEDGSEFADTCNVLVNGSGVVNKWKWPAIEGLHDFRGTLAHSAAWDPEIDWKDKTVAVLGSGSSSIQLVPQLGKTAKHLTVCIRNPTYVGPLMATSIPNKEADPEAKDPAVEMSHTYTEKEKAKFRDDPEYLLNYRRTIESAANAGFPIFIRGSQYNQGFKQVWQSRMKEKLAQNEELAKFLIPDWSPGCRRLSPGNNYLETLIQPNVTVCTSEVVKITPTGIVTADGREIGVDIIACATGFNVQYLPHFKMTGLKGQIMQDQATPMSMLP